MCVNAERRERQQLVCTQEDVPPPPSCFCCPAFGSPAALSAAPVGDRAVSSSCVTAPLLLTDPVHKDALWRPSGCIYCAANLGISLRVLRLKQQL